MSTPVPMTIDFVSDIVCPWCVIGLRGLEMALDEVADVASATIRFHPFELNPDMAAEGENIAEHVARKYGPARGSSGDVRAMIAARGQDVGFTFNTDGNSRIWNSFDAHRLMDWAGELGLADQRALQHALFAAYFTEGRSIADHGVLLDAVDAAGLDRTAAAAVLASDAHAGAVRGQEEYWRREGVQSVPTMIVNSRYVISGGHPPHVLAKALRSIAAEA